MKPEAGNVSAWVAMMRGKFTDAVPAAIFALMEKNEFICPACSGVGAYTGMARDYRLAKCGDCATVFVSPMPSDDVLTAFYSGYKKNARYFGKKDKKVRRAKLRLRFLPVRRGMCFLDVGCNAGFAVAAALQRNLDAHGIDIDREAIEAAQTWLPPERFKALSIEEYAAQGHRADMVYSSEVLEHVPNPDGFVGALSQVLRPGGWVYITCPDAGHFRRPRNFTDWKEVRPPEHLIYYTRDGLRRLFARHGFASFWFRPHLKPSHRMLARKRAS